MSDPSVEAIKLIHSTLLCNNPWYATAPEPGKLDGRFIFAKCTWVLNQPCPSCVVGILPMMLRLLEDGYYLGGFKLDNMPSEWNRTWSESVLTQAGFPDNQRRLILIKTDEITEKQIADLAEPQ